jgi:DNA mismatch repair protein MutS
LRDTLDELGDIAHLIASAIVDEPPILLRQGGVIRPGYDSALDNLHRAVADGKDWLAALEAREKARTGIKNLRVRYNEVFGFFIEVPRSAARLVPVDYERRATITHAERYVTPELKAQESLILDAQDRSEALEYALFTALREQIAAHALRLLNTGHALAELDTLVSLAEAAARHGYVRPVVADDAAIAIEQGRHPVVERNLPEGERFVPNDAHLDGEGRVLVITGPNMSGKSVYIRQVALITLMAQIGSFVPAASARIGLADRIFVRAGASDDIAQGRSTFLVEMSETAYILRHATPRSLIILDEVGRGTSTYDGMSIAWAVAEFIHDVLSARALFATHYHELTRMAERLEGVRNLTMAIAERGREVVFLRQVIPGGADKSYGIHVARLAGLPEPVVQRAWTLLREMEGEPVEGGRQPVASQLTPASFYHTAPAVAQRALADAPGDLPIAWAGILRELFALDIANMTPVQALVALNALQQQLRQEGLGQHD